jgi:hypothetical protein
VTVWFPLERMGALELGRSDKGSVDIKEGRYACCGLRMRSASLVA